MLFKEIREIINVWDNVYGEMEYNIYNTEKRIGYKLPKILRQYYQELGTHAINSIQDFLLEIDKDNQEAYKQIKLDNEYLIFYKENQSCHY